jgi:hypothetical protein
MTNLLTPIAARKLGIEHGFQMASESGSNDAGSDGWDGMLINADPQFAREQFGWDGLDSSAESFDLLQYYCDGCQHGADKAVKQNKRKGTR